MVSFCILGFVFDLVLLLVPVPCRYVDKARMLLDTTFTTLIGESYKRAYNSMVMIQELSELEEIIQFKK